MKGVLHFSVQFLVTISGLYARGSDHSSSKLENVIDEADKTIHEPFIEVSE